MSTFPVLLSRSVVAWNRRGTLIAWGMAVFGVSLVFAHVLFARQALSAARPVAGSIVGVERFGQLEAQWRQSGYGAQALQDAVQEITDTATLRIQHLPKADQDAQTMHLLVTVTNALGPILLLYTLAWAILQLLCHAYFLVAAALEPSGPDAAWRRLLRHILPITGTWIIICLVSGCWIPPVLFALSFLWPPLWMLSVLSVAVPAVVLPRLMLAPVLLLQGGRKVVDSVRLSYSLTQGRWRYIVRMAVGGAVAVWIAATLIGVALALLVRILLPYSPSAPWLLWLLTFVGLAGVAFRTLFLVELAEDVAGEKTLRNG